MEPIQGKSHREGLSRRLVKDIHAQLKTALKNASLLNNLDYFEMSLGMKKRGNAPFPSFEWVSCAPVSGAGQDYVYIGAVYKGRHNLIFIGKTSKGFQVACEVANVCARELRG